MNDKKRPIHESYTPKKVDKSYRPKSPTDSKPKPETSYTPIDTGASPTSRPIPPGKE